MSALSRRPLRSRLSLALAGLAAVVAAPLAIAAPAQAHAHLEGGDPKAGSAIEVAPERITLTFSEELAQLGGSRANQIIVTDRDGDEVTTGKLKIDGMSMSRSLKPLPAGTYDVAWSNLSVDGHRLSSADEYAFTVTKGEEAPASSAGTAGASEGASEEARMTTMAEEPSAASGSKGGGAVAGKPGELVTDSPSAAPVEDSSSSTQMIIWIVAGFLVLAILLGIVLQLTRRKAPREH